MRPSSEDRSVKKSAFPSGNPLQRIEKASQSSPPAGAKDMKFVFYRGVYVVENTSRPASVEFVRYKRTNYARSRVYPFRKSG